MISPSMDSITVHGWQALLVVESSDKTYGFILCKSLPSMEDPSIRGWKTSMGGMQQVTNTLHYTVRH